MTRNQAIEIEMKNLQRHMAKAADVALIATANIDALIELGVLVVEPEPIADSITAKIGKFADRMKFEGSIDAFEILLYKHGLKLVKTDNEKS